MAAPSFDASPFYGTSFATVLTATAAAAKVTITTARSNRSRNCRESCCCCTPYLSAPASLYVVVPHRCCFSRNGSSSCCCRNRSNGAETTGGGSGSGCRTLSNAIVSPHVHRRAHFITRSNSNSGTSSGRKSRSSTKQCSDLRTPAGVSLLCDSSRDTHGAKTPQWQQ